MLSALRGSTFSPKLQYDGAAVELAGGRIDFVCLD